MCNFQSFIDLFITLIDSLRKHEHIEWSACAETLILKLLNDRNITIHQSSLMFYFDIFMETTLFKGEIYSPVSFWYRVEL